MTCRPSTLNVNDEAAANGQSRNDNRVRPTPVRVAERLVGELDPKLRWLHFPSDKENSRTAVKYEEEEW